MRDEQEIHFGPFRFDPVALHLWKGEQIVAVQPKPLAVLRALATRPGQVVTKRELLKEVWAGTYVTQAVLKVAIRALREALGERANAPHYVETIGRDGYRFAGTVRSPGSEVRSLQHPTPGLQPPVPIIVGREADLVHLHQLLEKALRGEPQFVFITGEPGIGKTTLVEAFLQTLESERVVQGPKPVLSVVEGSKVQEDEERQNAKGKTQKAKVGDSSPTPSPQPLAPVLIGYGQCIEHYGEGEAYLPVLEAMGRLCRDAGGPQLITLLRRYAPTWLVQLPGVIEENELQTLRLQVQGATQQRMLREMAEAIEVGTVRRPLVLILEDLHWSDQATVELLTYLAKRRQRAHLLVVGTYRPIDAVMRAHPIKNVKQELQAHGLCEELRLELLTQQETNAYLARRFPASEIALLLAQVVYQRTEGNALFMVNVVEHCITQRLVVQENGQWMLMGRSDALKVPENLQQLLTQQVERLSAEQRHVLEGGSVAGMEFAVAVVAAPLQQPIDRIEEVCEELAWQGHFLEEQGIAEWPDGTLSGRYKFRHALYQSVLYDRMAEARRIRLHRLIGERLEGGYEEQAKELAAELAVHFERGHDTHRAIQYRQQAGQNALRRSAHQEAITHLTKGLALLQTLPDTPDRIQQELTLQLALGGALMATKGYAVPEVENVYSRARELCQQVGEAPQLFSALQGLFAFYLMRGDLLVGHELAEQCYRLAQTGNNPSRLLWAHHGLAQTSYFLGHFALAQDHAEQGIALYDSQPHRAPTTLAVQDPGVACRCFAAFTLWFLGYPEQALKKIEEALTLAQERAHLHSLAFARSYAAAIHNLRHEGSLAQAQTEPLIQLCTEQGFSFWLAWGTVMQGWALAEQGRVEEGIAQIRNGLDALQLTGAEMWRPWFLTILAAEYEKAEQTEAGLTALTDALSMVEKNGEQLSEVELYRLRGELTLAQSRVQSLESRVKKSSKLKLQSAKSKNTDPRSLTPDPQEDAEMCFLKAIEIARHQQAKSLELRAATSLARLWQQQGKRKEAHEVLAGIYNWFTEGFDTKDLQEAKALIEELSH